MTTVAVAGQTTTPEGAQVVADSDIALPTADFISSDEVNKQGVT